jgi:predicted DCC family thiol-disulfide oxidoreductase YuxK
MGTSPTYDYSIEELESKSIVFYDGTCGLCHGSIQWLLRRENANRFLFATQQGPVFEKLLNTPLKEEAIVYFRDGVIHEDAQALAYICKDLGKAWPVFYYLWAILPKALSRYLYFGIAKRRYGIFGKANSCALPPLEQRKQFLP